MVGIGTSDVNLDKYRHTFCSLLGKDEDSWGLSYTGKTGSVRKHILMFKTPHESIVHKDSFAMLHMCFCQVCYITTVIKWAFRHASDRDPLLAFTWTPGTALSLSTKTASASVRANLAHDRLLSAMIVSFLFWSIIHIFKCQFISRGDDM